MQRSLQHLHILMLRSHIHVPKYIMLRSHIQVSIQVMFPYIWCFHTHNPSCSKNDEFSATFAYIDVAIPYTQCSIHNVALQHACSHIHYGPIHTSHCPLKTSYSSNSCKYCDPIKMFPFTWCSHTRDSLSSERSQQSLHVKKCFAPILMFPYTLCSHIHDPLSSELMVSSATLTCTWEHNVYGNMCMAAQH